MKPPNGSAPSATQQRRYPIVLTVTANPLGGSVTACFEAVGRIGSLQQCDGGRVIVGTKLGNATTEAAKRPDGVMRRVRFQAIVREVDRLLLGGPAN